MRIDVIPLETLTKGRVYRLRSRNLDFGVYDGAGGFIGVREKFGSRYLFTEYYAGPRQGTAAPLEDLGPLPDGIELREYEDTIDQLTDRPVAFDRPVAAGGRGWYFLDTNESSPDIRPGSRTYAPLFDYLEALVPELPNDRTLRTRQRINDKDAARERYLEQRNAEQEGPEL